MEQLMIKLPAELTIVQVDEYKSKILQAIEDNDVIEIDDSDVVRIDTVGIQLLLATVTFVAAQNKEMQWQSSASVISDTVKQLGFNEPILNQYLSS